jgi:hypothetical protein
MARVANEKKKNFKKNVRLVVEEQSIIHGTPLLYCFEPLSFYRGEKKEKSLKALFRENTSWTAGT